MDELTAKTRILSAFPEARVAIVSKYDQAPMRLAATRAGACAYAVKDSPIGLRESLSGQAKPT